MVLDGEHLLRGGLELGDQAEIDRSGPPVREQQTRRVTEPDLGLAGPAHDPERGPVLLLASDGQDALPGAGILGPQAGPDPTAEEPPAGIGWVEVDGGEQAPVRAVPVDMDRLPGREVGDGEPRPG